MKYLVLYSLWLWMLCWVPLHASELDQVHREAASLMREGNAKKAYRVLLDEYQKGQYDNQTLFLLGLACGEQKNYDEGIEYLKIILHEESQNVRVRLELARLYYEKGDHLSAKKEFYYAQSFDLPEKVGQTVTRYLQAIEEGGVIKKWVGHFTVGYMYDDNFNTGTSSDSVFMFDVFSGGISAVSVSGPAQDHARIVDTRLSRLVRLGETHYWQTDLKASMLDYKDWSDYDNKQLSFSTGPIFVNGRWTMSLPVIGNIVKYGRDADFGEYYHSSYGVAPQLKINLNDHLSYNTSLIYYHRHFRDRGERNTDSFIWDHYVRRFMNHRSYMDLGLTLEDSRANDDAFSYDGLGAYIRYHRELWRHMSVSGQLSYRHLMYDAHEGLFVDRRDDKVLSLSVKLSYYLASLDSTASFVYKRTRNQNHLDFYDYDRDQYQFLLTKHF